ncbi:MAG: polysaccharide lyase, partial [Planctomycetota bacterium]
HGLGPDNRITGGDKVEPDGWSARAMWHPKSLDTYVYCQDKANKYGQGPDQNTAFQFEKERYYSVSIYVKVNEPATKANGIAAVYVDGRRVSEDRDIKFRSVEGDHTKITHLLFSTFHGGDSKSWAPRGKDGKFIDVYAYFDNFAVYKGRHVRKKPGGS